HEVHRGARPLQGEADPDTARAGAEVEDARGLVLADLLLAEVDQRLGLGTRDEDLGSDDEVAAVELLAPEDVGQRFSPGPPFDALAIGGELLRRERLVEVEEEAEAVHAEGVGEEEIGVGSRRVGPLLLQVGGGPEDRPANRPHFAHGLACSLCWSLCAMKWLRTATRRSWMSPSRTAWRLWRV